MLRFISATSAIALLAALPQPAFAQIDGTTVLARLNKAGAEIEEALAAAEAERLAGQCARRDEHLKRAKSIIEELEGLQSNGNGLGGDPERTQEARARAQAIFNAPCPPTAEKQPPAQPVAVNREPGQTRTLEDLQIEYAASLCGREQEEAKRRLLVALQRAIDMERNPAKRDRLLAQRDKVAARPVVPCDEAGRPIVRVPAPTPAPAPQSDGPPPSVMDDMGETAPNRSSLDVLRERMDALSSDCDDLKAFLDTKRALLDEIGRRLEAETDPSKKIELRELYNRYSGKLPPTCTPRRNEPPKTAPDKLPPPAPVADLPSDGSPLAAVAVVQEDRRKEMAKRAAVLIQVYYLGSLIPRGNIGVRRDGAPGAAPETDAGRTSHRVNGFGISAGFQTKISPDFDLRATLEYEKGDAKTAFTTPATSPAQRVDTGIVYGQLSNGSSGAIAGFGSTGNAKVDLEEWGADIEVGWQIAESSYLPYAVGLRAFTSAQFRKANRRYATDIASSGLSGASTFTFAQTRLQKLNEDYVGVSVGLDAEFPIIEELKLAIMLSGGPYRVVSRLDSTEHNTANFGPMANRDFTIAIDGKAKHWGARFRTGAGLQYKLSDSVSLTAGVGYEYRSKVGAVFNPYSGDQVFFEGMTTGLTSQDWQAFDAAIGLAMRF